MSNTLATSIEDLVDKLFGADVFHVQPFGGKYGSWKRELEAVFTMPFVLDAVVHESHKARGNDDTGLYYQYGAKNARGDCCLLCNIGQATQQLQVAYPERALGHPATLAFFVLSLVWCHRSRNNMRNRT